MITVSADYQTALTLPARTFSARLMYQGAAVSGKIRSLKVNKGSCGESQFDIGSVFVPYIECTIDECLIPLQDKELLLQIGIMTNDDLEDPIFDYADIGYFTVYNPTVSSRRSVFMAYGRLASKCNSAYISGLTFPAEIGDVLDEIENDIGLTITRRGIDETLEIESNPSGWRYIEVLNIIAGLVGGYVTENNSGGIVISTYTAASTGYAADGSYCTTDPTFSNYHYVIDGITCRASLDQDSEEAIVYTYGTGKYEYRNEYMTQVLFTALVGDLIGFSYDPGTIILAKGDPRLEPWDTVIYTDDAGVVYNVPCMSISLTYDGGLSTQIIAPGKSEAEEAAVFGGPMSQRIERLISDAELTMAIAAKARDTADNANTLYYDHTYTEENDTYTFTAYLYRGKQDVTSLVDPDHFVWFLRTEDGDEFYGSGRTITVTEAELGYRASVIGGYNEVMEANIVTSDGDYEATSAGDRIITYAIGEV